MTSHKGEQQLWQAVITQAIHDAASDSINPLLKQAAVEWLTIPNDDFATVL